MRIRRVPALSNTFSGVAAEAMGTTGFTDRGSGSERTETEIQKEPMNGSSNNAVAPSRVPCQVRSFLV